MSGNDNLYHMIVLLEEIIEDVHATEQDGSNEETKKMHEFVEELELPFQVDELDALNKWFDKFDEEICIPNEGHIKYEITSDGMMVLILDKDSEHLIDVVKKFVQVNSS